MKKHLVIGIDVDGVLANFFLGWLEVAGQLGIEGLPAKSEIDWLQIDSFFFEDSFNISPIDSLRIKEKIRETNNFWFNLKKLSSITHDVAEQLVELCSKHTCFFITDRFETCGKSAQIQTEEWISCFLGIKHKNFSVLVSGDKANLAKALDLDVSIDDCPRHLLGYLGAGVDKVFAPLVGYTLNVDARVEFDINNMLKYCLNGEVAS